MSIIKNSNEINLIKEKNSLLSIVIEAIEEKKAENILILDLKPIKESVADYFVICEATTITQVKAIGDYIIFMVKKKCQSVPYGQEGEQSFHWLLIDYVDVVVHIFLPETRKLFNLEAYWNDALKYPIPFK